MEIIIEADVVDPLNEPVDELNGTLVMRIPYEDREVIVHASCLRPLTFMPEITVTEADDEVKFKFRPGVVPEVFPLSQKILRALLINIFTKAALIFQARRSSLGLLRDIAQEYGGVCTAIEVVRVSFGFENSSEIIQAIYDMFDAFPNTET